MLGKTLGNFEGSTLLDKGGMGEVYQAKDKMLGRDVAIKVGEYLNDLELKGIMKQRDKIVDYFETLIAEKGEYAVLYR